MTARRPRAAECQSCGRDVPIGRTKSGKACAFGVDASSPTLTRQASWVPIQALGHDALQADLRERIVRHRLLQEQVVPIERSAVDAVSPWPYATHREFSWLASIPQRKTNQRIG